MGAAIILHHNTMVDTNLSNHKLSAFIAAVTDLLHKKSPPPPPPQFPNPVQEYAN